MTDKPLFIPLKKEWYEAFERGEKHVEFRRYGARWNRRTCADGRAVILSCGYGKQRRMKGVIIGVKATNYPPDFVRQIYPTGAIICINIKVEK